MTCRWPPSCARPSAAGPRRSFSTLAHGRNGYLWEALRERQADHPETLRILTTCAIRPISCGPMI